LWGQARSFLFQVGSFEEIHALYLVIQNKMYMVNSLLTLLPLFRLNSDPMQFLSFAEVWVLPWAGLLFVGVNLAQPNQSHSFIGWTSE